MCEEPGNSAIASECKHHAGVGCETEESSEEYADDDEAEEHDCAVGTEDVDEDLEDGVAVVGVEGFLKILNRKQKRKHDEEAE